MPKPIKPEHADKVEPVPGADPRFTIRRQLSGYAYPVNGNVHNPTPVYTWHLMVDGKLVDSDSRRRPLALAARIDGDQYLAEIDGRKGL
jgi:hypothetical protein